MNINTLQTKYGLFFVNKKRFYKEDLTKRDLTLTYSVPELIRINGTAIRDRSWSNLVQQVAIYLHNLNPAINLLEFKVDWGDMTIFTTHDHGVGSKEIYPGLYLYATFTAQHSCWVIQDLLTYFGINLNEVELIIHRNPGGEPKEVRDFIINEVETEFKQYLCSHYNFDIVKAEHIVNNINNILNKIMPKVSASFDNLFLFDEANKYGLYKGRFKDVFLGTSYASYTKNIRLVNKYLDYFTDFYRDSGY